MINQIVLLKWAEAADTEQCTQACDALRALPAKIPSLLSLTVVTDESGHPDNFDVAVLTTFGDEQDWRSYQEHPAHKQAVQQHLAPILASKAAVLHVAR